MNEHTPIETSQSTAMTELQSALDASRAKEDGRQILTRAQQRREAEETALKAEQGEAADLDERIKRSEQAIAKLAEVVVVMKKNRADLGIIINSRQESIHVMRKAGVEL